MNLLLEAAAEICAFLGARKWRYCIIGGLAVQVWGEPRTTLDADLTLLTGLGEEERFAADILAGFQPRIPDAARFAAANRVLLIRASNGKDVDISFGALPFEESMVARARKMDFGGVLLPVCTAEDLVVMKAFASRDKDWSDVQGICTRQQALDTSYILAHLQVLAELKEAPEIVTRLRNLLEAAP